MNKLKGIEKFENYLNDLINLSGNYIKAINELNNHENTNTLVTIAKEVLEMNNKPSQIETIEDLAKLLDGNFYGSELKNPYNIDVEKLCEERKWIVLFPYSDDNLEVRGYIDDEIGAWDGVTAVIYKKGEFYPEDLGEETFKKAKNDMIWGINDDMIFDAEVEDGKIGIDMRWRPEDQPYTWYIIIKYYYKDKDNKPIVSYFDLRNEEEEDTTWARCCVIDLSNVL